MGKSYFLSTTDASKQALMLPEILLEGVNLWPKQRKIVAKIAFWAMMTLLIILETGQLIYFIININDLSKMALTMSTLSTTIQGIVKMIVMYTNRENVEVIIDAIKNDFWPSDLMGSTLEKELKLQTRSVVTCMYMMYIFGIVFAAGFLSAPLRDGTASLPFESWYPFDWQLSPYYEIIYLTQWLVNMYVVVTTICGHDYIFFATVSNCVAQFKLMNLLLKQLGVDDKQEILREIRRIRKTVGEFADVDEELLVLCVKHHLKLMKICDYLNTIFALSLFVQLLASVTAICVSSYLITMGTVDAAQISSMASYCVGHVLQLYLFCAAGNELTYQSIDVSSAAFASDWYKRCDNKVMKIGLIMLMQRSHKGNTISVMGVAKLNNETFLAVLRLSFSFYTLLSSLTV